MRSKCALAVANFAASALEMAAMSSGWAATCAEAPDDLTFPRILTCKLRAAQRGARLQTGGQATHAGDA